MKISLKWLQKFNLDLSEFFAAPQKLSDLLTFAGLEVESFVNQARQYDHVVTAEILERNQHPGADRLTLCLVSTGADQKHRIVCGAKNHKAGDKVVLALPGAVLPGDFAIKVSKIRGEESQGMLCSAKELGLANESEGIVILPSDTRVGISFAQYAEFDDVIFEIKVPPNRSDCLSHFGMAREIASLTGKSCEFPVTPFNEGRESTRKLVKVTVEDSERCPRYAGRVVKDVKIGPSPDWLKRALEAVGLRSINNVVDITNYVMMGMGQPLHAFDMAKLEGGQIIVRGAKKGEDFETLDEKKLKLSGSELVIADAKKPLALAGVMGGINSGVTDNTKDLFIESAFFMPSAVRRAARLHGLDTDSSYRFSRGVDPEAVVLGLNKACQLLEEVASGTVCADLYDFYPRPLNRPRIELDLKFISARLGMTFDGPESKRILERVGCSVSGAGTKLLAIPPPYRSDLKCAEDLGEELLRFKGFHQVAETIPTISKEPTSHDPEYLLEQKLSATLREAGLSQAVNLNLVSSNYEDLFKAPAGDDGTEGLGFSHFEKPVFIQNPINQDLNSLRRLVLPNLIKNAAFNMRHGNQMGGLFEIAPVFFHQTSIDLKNEKRPFGQEMHVGLISWGQQNTSWIKSAAPSVYYQLKGIVEYWLQSWAYKSQKFEPMEEAPNYLHPGKSARVLVEGKTVGIVGILHPIFAERMELEGEAAVAEFNLRLLFESQPRAMKYKDIPKFPSVERDVAFLVPDVLLAGEIKMQLLKAAAPLAKRCEPFDVFSGDKLPAGQKSLAFRVVYRDDTRTLSDDEVNATHQKAVQSISSRLKIDIR